AYPGMMMLPPSSNPYHYSLASNQQHLPPLFKLVLDSTLPITNYASHGFLNQNTIPATTTQYLKRSMSTASGSSSAQARKKRECPTCHMFFSNLTTHKAIHNKDSKPFTCPTCSRSFKRLNDLIRHEKCHLSKIGEWEFRCPYYDPSKPNGLSVEPCHHTGYFTRCDTFKNHLKAIHFKYPTNTLKSERQNVSGNCKECGQFFKNGVMEWLSDHVESGNCT
ncbi:hypothetical protein CANARDRAFT_184188, partial [[Candida] arabinofermentans NRRL YB-2248]